MSKDGDILWDIVKFNKFLSFDCSVARVKISKFIFPSDVSERNCNEFSDFGLEVMQNYLHIGAVCSTTATIPLKKNQIILLNMPKGLSPSAYKEGVFFRDCKKVRTIIFSVPDDVYNDYLLGSETNDQILVATSILSKVDYWKFLEYEIFSAYCRSFDSEAIRNHINTSANSSDQPYEAWHLFLLLCSSRNVRKQFRKILKFRCCNRNEMMLSGHQLLQKYSTPVVEDCLPQLKDICRSGSLDLDRVTDFLSELKSPRNIENNDDDRHKYRSMHYDREVIDGNQHESGPMEDETNEEEHNLHQSELNLTVESNGSHCMETDENQGAANIESDHSGTKPVEMETNKEESESAQSDTNVKSNIDQGIKTDANDGLVNNESDDSEVEFNCLDCGDQFQDGASFDLHTKTHKNYRKHVCKLCGVRFLKSSGLQRHMTAIHTGERAFKCEVCERGFSNTYGLDRHMKSHSASRDFPCSVCKKNYNSKRNLMVHMRVHTGEKPFECDMCDKKFTSGQNLKLHQRYHYDLKLFVCKYCGRSFSRNGNCKYHMKVQHKDKKDVALKCYSCKKRFTSEKKLLLHTVTHNKKKIIECRKCFKKFDVESELREHEQNVHSVDRPLKCNDCGAGFIRSVDRDRHQIRHKGEPTIMCSFCGKGFFMKFDCQRHELLIHIAPVPKIIKIDSKK